VACKYPHSGDFIGLPQTGGAVGTSTGKIVAFRGKFDPKLKIHFHTVLMWPLKLAIQSPVSTQKILIMPSALEETNVFSI
jgi:hypothetical protein